MNASQLSAIWLLSPLAVIPQEHPRSKTTFWIFLFGDNIVKTHMQMQEATYANWTTGCPAEFDMRISIEVWRHSTHSVAHNKSSGLCSSDRWQDMVITCSPMALNKAEYVYALGSTFVLPDLILWITDKASVHCLSFPSAVMKAVYVLTFGLIPADNMTSFRPSILSKSYCLLHCFAISC